MSPEPSRELLRRWALEAGFDRAGVARLDPSEHGEAYRRWIAAGHQAEMRYLERRTDVRLDPRRLLEGARSALCVALQYAPGEDDEPAGEVGRRVARYARGRDYHDVMLERLRALGQRIERAFPAARTRSYVDTGPLLERELAARAGLGAIGKNTLLLHPEAGSYFLLGEILLTLELVPDVPLADVCGSCRACLDACPTGALVAPRVLDSRRCISYWTIEHRGEIPEAVRPGLGQWVFGCDVCQEVCPWNATATPAREAAFREPESRRGLRLIDLLTISRESYVELFRGSPLKRAKREGLRRNAAVVLGNRGRAQDEDGLRHVATGESDLVARHAAWAADRIARGTAGRPAEAHPEPGERPRLG